MKNRNLLTEREEKLMEAIWESGIPLTSVEMLALPDISTWNETNLYRTINALLDKKLIRVCGVEQYKTQYARQFEPTLSKEEYVVRIFKDKGMKRSSIARIAMALVKDEETDEEGETFELIQQLEHIIKDLRNEKG